ncbi:MAG: hypothetical protein HFH15_14410 [Ruminococcus sp.]|nr:hypothetical protein [Ruminococcus sp.]
MKHLKEISISILCKFGKYGMGRSIIVGMYDFEVPKKLVEYNSNEDSNEEESCGGRK